MSLQAYLSFILASIVLCIVPGPDMVYLLARSIAQGKKAGLYAAFGINTGAYVHLTAAVLGLSAILAASSTAFTLVKWLGAAYLVYLGISAIMARQGPLLIRSDTVTALDYRAIYWQGFFNDVLNPKVAIFYLAILPQFITPGSAHPSAQLLVLGVTLNIIGIITNLLYIWFSSSLTDGLRNKPHIASRLNKLMGGVFIALGLKLAGDKS